MLTMRGKLILCTYYGDDSATTNDCEKKIVNNYLYIVICVMCMGNDDKKRT